MRPDHAEWRERVLAYEELEAGERAQADAHLESCPACRELLHALRHREAAAREGARLPSEPLPLEGRDADDERASAERLLARLASPAGEHSAAPPARAEAPRVRPLRARPALPAWAWLAPAAAAAVLAIVFWGGPGRERASAPTLGGLAVEHASSMRGANDPVFRTGDAFSIRFELAAAARPIVVALDEAGTAEVLYPTGDAAARLFPAGVVVLPDSASGERWTFSGPPGRETFLAGSLRRPTVDLRSLLAELASATAAATDRDGRVRAARAVLEKHAESVGEVSVSHESPAPR